MSHRFVPGHPMFLTPTNALGMNVFLRCESQPNLPRMTQRRHVHGKLYVGVI